MLSLWKGSGKSCWAGQGRRFNLRLGALNLHVWPTPACIFQCNGWETALILTAVFIPGCSCKGLLSAKTAIFTPSCTLLTYPPFYWDETPGGTMELNWGLPLSDLGWIILQRHKKVENNLCDRGFKSLDGPLYLCKARAKSSDITALADNTQSVGSWRVNSSPEQTIRFD